MSFYSVIQKLVFVKNVKEIIHLVRETKMSTHADKILFFVINLIFLSHVALQAKQCGHAGLSFPVSLLPVGL